MKKGMKNAGRIGWMVWCVLISFSAAAQQSSAADQRMNRDIEVAENILSTLLRQEAGSNRRSFFPMEVKGSYVPGYGVTLRLPFTSGGRFAMAIGGGWDAPVVVDGVPGVSYSYSYSSSERAAQEAEVAQDAAEREREAAERDRDRVIKEKDQVRMKTPRQSRKQVDMDSVVTKARQRFLAVSKDFLADYGDVIGGLKSEEKVIITNRGDNFEPDFDMVWVNGSKQGSRAMLSVEAKRGDIEQLKQGKINRDEFMKRLKVVDTQSEDSVDPDLEVFSSLFGRLYREDLSQTYYAQNNPRYERLKDFGVIYYLKVYSSLETEHEMYSMPSLDLRDVPKADRDKKVKEMYPKFESELKDNIVEYGRTLRSLKDEEQLVFQIRLTTCKGCGIPEAVEVSVKAGALKDYSSGKATKEATLAKVSVKKTGVQ